MAKASIRIELPRDFDAENVELPGKLADAVGDALCKAHDHSEPRKLPHRYPQSLIDKAARLYRSRSGQMLEEIIDVLGE